MGQLQGTAAKGLGEAQDTPADCSAAALRLRGRGWSVIPIEPHGKRPLVAWREFQQRLATAGEIDAWFGRWPDANVGIVTGQVSGIVVVDVDPRHDGIDSLARIEREHGALPLTVEARTGGGGRHLYFAHPGAPVPNRVAMHAGIDLRADGGCVVAPPSLHANGGRYAWAAGRGPGEVALAPLPMPFSPALRAAEHAGHSRMHWRRLIRDGVAEGERNATLASLTGHLLWRSVDSEIVLELMLSWNRTHCRPPLPDDEVARVVQSIAGLHGHGAEGIEPP